MHLAFKRFTIALGAILLLSVVGCSAGSTAGHEPSAATPGFNVAVGHLGVPSDHRGGTLRCACSGEPDSFDPGNTYYGWVMDFARLYCRPLITYMPNPAGGVQLVPDLADSLGAPSDDFRTWTYHLRPGVKFEDGTSVTSQDVAYAVLRSLDKVTLPNGPTYFGDWLALPVGFVSVYRTPQADVRTAIETPDARTIVFHLKRGYPAFDNFAALPATTPVPKAKDTGKTYADHVVATGPYMFKEVQRDRFYSLGRNPAWDPATDPIRKALPDSITLALNCNALDLDARLIAGDLDLDVTGSGLQTASLPRVLGDAGLKARCDNPDVAMTWYAAIVPQTPPFDRVEVRRALEFATDRLTLQSAYGGPLAGGVCATSLMPKQIEGHTDFDLYPSDQSGEGDLAQSRQLLKQAGLSNGFDMILAYRVDRPKEKAAAEALQQAWARVGIKATLNGYPAGPYFPQYVGRPEFNRKNNIGVILNGWGADWLDGYGFLVQVVDSRVIREAGNSNLGIKDPEIDKLVDQATTTADASARNVLWGRIDRRVMENAYVIPGVWARVLLLRGSRLTNVAVNDAYQMYDYALLGVR